MPLFSSPMEHHLTLPLLAVVLLVAIVVLAKLVSFCKEPALRPPPGPWRLPLIGSLHHLLLTRPGLPHQAMRDLSRKHGPLMLLRLGAVPTLVVSSPEAAREVMQTHDAAFASRHLSATLAIFSCGGRGILFSPYGELWRQLRKVCVLELFSARRVQSFRTLREDEAARLLRSVAADASSGLVHLTEKICRMTNDMVARAAIGARCEQRDEFLRELEEAVRLCGGFNVADLWPESRLARRLSTAVRGTERCNGNLRRILGAIVREHPIGGDAHGEEDLLGVMLRFQKDGGLQCPLTTEIITTVVMEIFAAGSETSSTTLEWAMSELIRNPRVLAKTQSEVREAFRGKHKITEDDICELSYLHLVIKETLRLHAPAPFLLPRECREPCRVMGYDVPKGAKVLVNVWAIGRDHRYWEDADVFKPERFETSDVDFRGANFEFLPFGAGRRICPGMMLGLANMELALASLLYYFDWELPAGTRPEDLDMTEAFGITVRRRSKLRLHAKLHFPFPN